MVLLFGSLAALVHTAVVFPLVVAVRSRLAPRPVRAPEDPSAATLPSVAVVIAARNEADGIGAKLDSLVASDYPAHLVQVVVASDGSDDATESVVAGYADRGVRLVALARTGKAAALNAAVGASSGDVLVFTDANSHFEPGALAALVAPLADPQVGGVAGDQRYLAAGAAAPGADGVGERGYWSFDRFMKRAESRGGSVISATGAIYAVRRELFEPVVDGVTDDFATSTRVIEQGRRLVFCEDAVAWEPVAASTGAEWNRKVRVITRGFRAVVLRRRLLDPRRHGFYAYQLLCHKVLRRLLAFPLLGLFLGSVAAWHRGPLPKALAVAQAGFYGGAVVGLVAPKSRLGRSRPCAVAAYVCMVNAAGAVAASNVVRGVRVDRWEPNRGADGDAAARGSEAAA